MSSEPNELSGKQFITYGTMRVEVEDPLNIQPVPVDCITDMKFINGMLWLSVGHFAQNGDGPLKAIVNSRLRIPFATTVDIQKFMEAQFAAAEEARKNAN